MLETCLHEVPAYHAWRASDPDSSFTIDARYASLPALTKADIRQYFPQIFVPAGSDLQRALASGEISFIETSGTTDTRAPNIWNQAWWDASERSSWELNSVAAAVATGAH